MTKQQAITGMPKQFPLSLWKRMILVTALFLSGGPLVLMASTQTAYASPISTNPTSASPTSPQQQTQNKPKVIYLTNIVITCIPGNGGKGGKATGKSGGAFGGNGGSCTVNIPIEISLTENNTVLSAKTVANANTVGHANIVKHSNTTTDASARTNANTVSSANTVVGAETVLQH